MANKFLTIDADQLKNKVSISIQKQAQKISKKIVKTASYALFDHIKQQADEKLHTRKEFYKNNLQIKPDSANDGYKIILKKPAHWIESGMDGRQLRDTMLAKGQRSRVIPLSDGVLTGTNKAKKVAPAGSVQFRTMTLEQASNRWQTKMIKGVLLFKEARSWFAEQLKAGTWSKK
jgi:hypothetical protein